MALLEIEDRGPWELGLDGLAKIKYGQQTDLVVDREITPGLVAILASHYPAEVILAIGRALAQGFPDSTNPYFPVPDGSRVFINSCLPGIREDDRILGVIWPEPRT